MSSHNNSQYAEKDDSYYGLIREEILNLIANSQTLAAWVTTFCKKEYQLDTPLLRRGDSFGWNMRNPVS